MDRDRDRKNDRSRVEKTSQYRVNKILVGNVTINSDIKYKEATRKRGRSQKNGSFRFSISRVISIDSRVTPRERQKIK